MRWNTRSAPERSTRTAMPGNFASNVLARLLGERQVHRGVEDDLAFLLRRFDQCGRDRFRGWRRGANG